MKKSILNLGKSLNKAEQRKVFGGVAHFQREGENCYTVMSHISPCPYGDEWSSGSGCWVKEKKCNGGAN